MLAQQREVQRLLARDAQPVGIEVARHAGEAPDRVERQIDGVELDVHHRVQQRRSALKCERRAHRHLFGWHEARQRRATRQVWRGTKGHSGVELGFIERLEQRPRARRLGLGIGKAQGIEGGAAKAHS